MSHSQMPYKKKDNKHNKRFERISQKQKINRKTRKHAREHELKRLIDPEGQPKKVQTYIRNDYGTVTGRISGSTINIQDLPT